MRAVSIAAILLLVTPAFAQPHKGGGGTGGTKAKSACGLKLLPLTVGNKWTFIPATPPVEPDEGKQRLTPVQPKQITIEVKDITTDGAKSVVQLEEDLDGRKLNTTITCGGGVFEPSLDSIFYSGEPGGSFNVELSNVTRTLKDVESGPSKPWTSKWREDVAAQWKRTPEAGMTIDLGAGKFELEHIYTLGGPEPVNPQYGKVTAQRLTIEISGRVSTTGDDKVFEMPANWLNAIWFAEGVGPVQINNAFYQAYQLSAANIVK